MPVRVKRKWHTRRVFNKAHQEWMIEMLVLDEITFEFAKGRNYLKSVFHFADNKFDKGKDRQWQMKRVFNPDTRFGVQYVDVPILLKVSVEAYQELSLTIPLFHRVRTLRRKRYTKTFWTFDNTAANDARKVFIYDVGSKGTDDPPLLVEAPLKYRVSFGGGPKQKSTVINYEYLDAIKMSGEGDPPWPPRIFTDPELNSESEHDETKDEEVYT